MCEALRAGGIEVWFDRNELTGGDAWDAWDAKLRRQIRECALFVPVISSNTDARSEGYFCREWRLAVDRTHGLADDTPFLLPVVIDDTLEGRARVPDRFRGWQWIRLPGGATSPPFVQQIANLTVSGIRAMPERRPSSPRPSTGLDAAHGVIDQFRPDRPDANTGQLARHWILLADGALILSIVGYVGVVRLAPMIRAGDTNTATASIASASTSAPTSGGENSSAVSPKTQSLTFPHAGRRMAVP